jgi:lambda family phage portal protein
MGVWSRFKSMIADALRPKPQRKRVNAYYDVAQTTDENANHWAWVDSLNANASQSPEVRRVLRERSRYECDNNGYYGGLIDKLSNDMVGTCPRLQVSSDDTWREVEQAVEAKFSRWAKGVNLGEKLRIMDAASIRDGEGFGLLFCNPRLEGVQLDIRLYESDQVETSGYQDYLDPLSFPGGRIDESGNVVEYHFRRSHPGSNVAMIEYDHDAIDASRVLHWYTRRRPGQLRGVPEATSSLSLFAYLRRYTLATVTAAETAANIAGVLETDSMADSASDSPTIDTMDTVPVARGSLLTLPHQWRASAFKADQPVTTYPQFKNELLTEAGAPVLAPRNVASNTSADYNYSSGRLDYGIYYRGIRVRRNNFASRILDAIFDAWLFEAMLLPGFLPQNASEWYASEWDRTWYFDGLTSLDPLKDAQAESTRLASGTTTFAEIFGDRGFDWEVVFRQRAKEKKLMGELGLDSADAVQAIAIANQKLKKRRKKRGSRRSSNA